MPPADGNEWDGHFLDLERFSVDHHTMPLTFAMSAPTFWILMAVLWLGIMGLYYFFLRPVLCRAMDTSPILGLIWYLARFFSLFWHRLEGQGMDILPDTDHARGLIVVSNHTGALDPFIIQSLCRFHIRWMMAREMMLPILDWAWRILKNIPVDRDGRDTGPTREAIRHVKAGGVLGIFPEGRIVSPPREIRPFHPGVGLIVARTKAPVLLCWAFGTPDTNKLGKALLTRSHAKVRFIELIDFEGERHAANIARILRERIAEVSGWPLNDEPLLSVQNDTDPFLV